MSAAELQELINRRVYLPVAGIDVECVVKNAKASYGKIRLLILPIRGKGETWVNASSVRPVEAERS
jgi:hypothetical protein